MKHIFVGSTQRTKLYSEIKKAILPTRICLIAVLLLLVVIPFAFRKKIFKENHGNYSPIAYVATFGGTGSAVYIGNNQLLSAAHVYAGMQVGDFCDVVFHDPNDGAITLECRAQLIECGKYAMTKNPIDDYALLKIVYRDITKIIKECPIGTSSTCRASDNIFIEGFPNGNYRKDDGIISSNQDRDFFAVSAGAWHGASGGALLDKNGNLIGIILSISQQVSLVGTIHFSPVSTYAYKIDKVKSIIASKGHQIP